MLGPSEDQMSQDDRRVEINISGVPVAGVGGLGLVAMAVLVSVVMPAARWAMLAGLAGGVALGVVLVVARRHIKSKGPSGTDPKILFRALPPDLPGAPRAKGDGRSHSGPAPVTDGDRELLTANC
jgi:hypothetical protein